MRPNLVSSEFTEPDLKPHIVGTDVLMERYGELFDSFEVKEKTYYIEKEIDDYTDEGPRFVATESMLGTLEGDSVWELDLKDPYFLVDVERALESIVAKTQKGEEYDTSIPNWEDDLYEKTLSYKGKDIRVVYQPYLEGVSGRGDFTKYIVNTLHPRLMKFLHK